MQHPGSCKDQGAETLLEAQDAADARAQVVLELVELREVDTARAMLRQTAVFAGMKQEEPDRFLRLEHLCGRAYFDVRRGAGLRGWGCAQAARRASVT